MIHLTKYGQKLNPAFVAQLEERFKFKHHIFIVKVLHQYYPAQKTKIKQIIKSYGVPKDDIIAYIN